MKKTRKTKKKIQHNTRGSVNRKKMEKTCTVVPSEKNTKIIFLPFSYLLIHLVFVGGLNSVADYDCRTDDENHDDDDYERTTCLCMTTLYASQIDHSPQAKRQWQAQVPRSQLGNSAAIAIAYWKGIRRAYEEMLRTRGRREWEWETNERQTRKWTKKRDVKLALQQIYGPWTSRYAEKMKQAMTSSRGQENSTQNFLKESR